MVHEHGNIDNSRTPEQRAHMEKTVGTGKCPFCDGNGFDPKLNITISEGDYWRAWHSPFKYDGLETQLVMAPYRHWTTLEEIPGLAWKEWGRMTTHLTQSLKLPGGALVMRFGENERNGGTLFHLHSHIMVPDMTTFAIAVFYKDRPLADFLKEAAERMTVIKELKSNPLPGK